MAEEKPIGKVVHFFGNISVAIIEFSKEAKVGDTIRVKGAHTDFTQTIDSMQYEHQSIDKAKKGQGVGIKVSQKAHQGDQVFAA